MAAAQPRSFLDASLAAAAERNGTAGRVQCEGCPPGYLTARPSGLCERHEPVHPDAWMSYEPRLDEGYDVAGNL